MVMENFDGKMVKNILENLKVIKERVKVYLVGVMAVYMRDSGVMANSMVREFSLNLMGVKKQEFGRLEETSSG